MLLDLKLSTSSDSEGLQQIQVAERVKSEQGMSAWPTCSPEDRADRGLGEHRLFGLGFFGLGFFGLGFLELGLRELSFRRLRCRWLGLRRQGRRRAATPAPQPTGAPAAGTHTVATGDTLSGIASSNGTTVQALAQRNALADPDALQPGQQLALR